MRMRCCRDRHAMLMWQHCRSEPKQDHIPCVGLQAHHAQVAALTGKAPPEDPFAAMERRLAEQQRVQQLQAASAAASYTQLSRQDGGPLASPAQEAQAGSDGGTTPEHQQTAAAHPHQQQ